MEKICRQKSHSVTQQEACKAAASNMEVPAVKQFQERMETVGDLVSSLREIGVELRANVVTIADAVSGPKPDSGKG
jgi:hypothetical protein